VSASLLFCSTLNPAPSLPKFWAVSIKISTWLSANLASVRKVSLFYSYSKPGSVFLLVIWDCVSFFYYSAAWILLIANFNNLFSRLASKTYSCMNLRSFSRLIFSDFNFLISLACLSFSFSEFMRASTID